MEFISPSIMHSEQIPAEFEQFRIPIAQVVTNSVPGLRVVSQKITLDNYEINFHIFDAEKRMPIRPTAREEILTIHYMLHGNIDAVLRRGRSVKLLAKEYNLFSLPPHKHFAFIEKGIYWSFHINLGPKIQQLLREDLFLFDFFAASFKESGGIINLRPYEVEARENILIAKVLNYKETGPDALSGLKPIIDDLVMAFCNKYSNEINAFFSQVRITDQQLANLSAMNAFLNHHLAQTHSIGSLAKEFRMTTDELESTFREMYGQRFADFYHEMRLSRVFSMLANHSLPFDRIAGGLGYSSLADLKIAFAEYFGKTMEEVRNFLTGK